MTSVHFLLRELQKYNIEISGLDIKGFDKHDSVVITTFLKVGINSVFFNCMICSKEHDISALDREEIPVICCLLCGETLKIKKLYESTFIEGKL